MTTFTKYEYSVHLYVHLYVHRDVVNTCMLWTPVCSVYLYNISLGVTCSEGIMQITDWATVQPDSVLKVVFNNTNNTKMCVVCLTESPGMHYIVTETRAKNSSFLSAF